MEVYLQVHQATVSCAKSLMTNENKLVELLRRCIEEKVHEKLGYGSLKEYCLKALHFSDERAYAIMTIARASLRVPEVNSLIQEGRLSIANARRIAKRIEPENKEFWLDKATTLSQHDLEKEIVKVYPAAKVKERIKPIAENLSSLLILINDAVEKKWNRANELLMQKKGGAVEKVAILEAALDKLLEAIDPVKKAERAAKRKADKTGVASAKVLSARRAARNDVVSARAGNNFNTRKPLSARLEHEITLRDGGQCTHRGIHGNRCSNRTFLHFHHIVPVAVGGRDELSNLTTLCSTHHRFVHGNDRYGNHAKVYGTAKGLHFPRRGRH